MEAATREAIRDMEEGLHPMASPEWEETLIHHKGSQVDHTTGSTKTRCEESQTEGTLQLREGHQVLSTTLEILGLT